MNRKNESRESTSQAKSKDHYSDFAEHPRYGKTPKLTGRNPQTNYAGRAYLHWHSGPDCRIPDTAIAADLSQQTPATVAVTDYYDVVRRCVDCDRQFIFFAAEQKFWYENLKFPLEADCIRCFDCRRIKRETDYLLARYEELLAVEGRSLEEALELIDTAITLCERSFFGEKVLEKLRAWSRELTRTYKVTHRKTYQDLVVRLEQLR